MFHSIQFYQLEIFPEIILDNLCCQFFRKFPYSHCYSPHSQSSKDLPPLILLLIRKVILLFFILIVLYRKLSAPFLFSYSILLPHLSFDPIYLLLNEVKPYHHLIIFIIFLTSISNKFHLSVNQAIFVLSTCCP